MIALDKTHTKVKKKQVRSLKDLRLEKAYLRGTGGGELSGDELYRARVFHEQRGHVPAQKRFHQRLEAGRDLDDVGERLAEPQHLVDVLHEPRPGLAGGKRA